VDAINGTATVYASDRIDITLPTGLRIEEMHVNTGQSIKPGDPIATFDINCLEETHIRETAALHRMRLELQSLERGASDDGAIENALRTLSRAQADYNAAINQSEADIAAAQAALDALGSPEGLRNHQRALEDYHAAITQGEMETEAARTALHSLNEEGDNALQNALRSHRRAIEDVNDAREQGEADVAAAQALYDNVRRASAVDRSGLENAQRAAQRARDDYQATRRQNEENIEAAENALLMAWNVYFAVVWATPQDPADITAAWVEVEKAQNTVETVKQAAEVKRLADARRVEDAEAALAQAQRGVNTATENEREQAATALLNEQTRAADNLFSAERRAEDTLAALSQAQAAFEATLANAQNAYESAESRAAHNVQIARRRVEDMAAALQSDEERVLSNLQNAVNTASSNRLRVARQVEDAALALANARQQAENTATFNHISATTLKLDIAAKQADVFVLEELLAAEGVLYATHTGSVTHAMQAGDKTEATPLVSLRCTEGNFHALLTVPRTQGERLSIGSASEVTTGGGSMFYVPTVTGVVSAISPPDDNDRVTVTIALPQGNWHIGQRVDAQVIFSRANFDLSVPISALHSDNAGYFLLVMQQRSTVMGLQNVAVRVNVTVVAADGTRASVMGAVDRNSQIITGSSKAVTAGDRIRVG
jgi:multidrug efflux pump subunit AcrA (membrane-fusion protein)